MPVRYTGAGDLDQLLKLNKDSAATGDDENALGELLEAANPTVVARDVPANVRTLTSDERRFAHAVEAGATHVIKVRFREDVTTKMWWTWGTRRLDISGKPIDQMNNRQFIEMACKERDA